MARLGLSRIVVCIKKFIQFPTLKSRESHIDLQIPGFSGKQNIWQHEPSCFTWWRLAAAEWPSPLRWDMCLGFHSPLSPHAVSDPAGGDEGPTTRASPA